MTSLTEYYVSLQKIYQAKAEADCVAMEHRVKDILKRIGRHPDSISRAYIKTFCKNARKLRVSCFHQLTCVVASLYSRNLTYYRMMRLTVKTYSF